MNKLLLWVASFQWLKTDSLISYDSYESVICSELVNPSRHNIFCFAIKMSLTTKFKSENDKI